MLSLVKIKKDTVDFWIKNQPKILFLLALVIALGFLRQLPYFNIILTLSICGVFLWIVSILLFGLRSDSSIIAVVFALLITGLAMAIQVSKIAQETANLAYYADIIAFFQILLESRDAKRAII